MKEKTTIPKRVKGTVLFTVVAVMMVLIVFLTATLALAVTANKRAYTAYQQEQTEYTAKAVLEAVNKNIADDTDGSHIRTDIVKLAAGASMPLTVEINDGTATEAHTVNITNTGQKRSIYENNAWKEVGVYTVSITINSNTTAASSTYESFLAMDVIPATTTTTTTTTINPGGGDGGAFVSLGDTGGNEIATKGYTTGGTYLGIGIPTHDYTMSSGGRNVIDAPFYVNGNLDPVGTEFWVHFTKPDDFMVVMGNLNVINDYSMQVSFAGYDATGETYESTPYIYVDKKFTVTVGNNNKSSIDKIGDSTHAVNLYCGSVNMTTNASSESIYGDIYLMDEDETSVLNASGSASRLYKWTKGALHRAEGYDTQYGNLYSMGSVNVTGAGITIDGDMQIKGDLTVNGPLTVTGNLVVEGTLTVNSNINCTGTVYAGTIADGSGTITAPSINAVKQSGTAYTEIAAADAPLIAARTTATNEYYDLSGTNVYNREVYPANYTKAYLNTNKLDQPAPANYTGTYGYPDSITSLATSLFNAGEYQVSVYSTDFKNAAPGKGTQSLRYAAAGASSTPANMVYYTAPGSDEGLPTANLNGIWGGEIHYQVAYTKHTVSGGTDTKEYEYNKMFVLPESGAAAYPDYASYFAANNADFNDIFSHAGAPATPYKNANLLKPSGANYYHVTTDCVLNGYFGDNIYLDGAGGAMTVILDNVSLNIDKSIIVNDANQVTIFVVNQVTVDQRGGILTTDYLDLLLGTGGWNLNDNSLGQKALQNMAGDVTIEQVQSIGDPKYPNVLIYSDSSSTLKPMNNTLVTAMVRAPELIYEGQQASVANKTVNYQLPTGNVVKYGSGCDISEDNGHIGLIGQLIAGKIKLSSDGKWGMLYITDPASSGIHPGSHSSSTTTTVTTTTPGSSSYRNLFSNVY